MDEFRKKVHECVRTNKDSVILQVRAHERENLIDRNDLRNILISNHCSLTKAQLEEFITNGLLKNPTDKDINVIEFMQDVFGINLDASMMKKSQSSWEVVLKTKEVTILILSFSIKIGCYPSTIIFLIKK